MDQAASHCRYAYPEKTVEIEMGNMHASGAADITIASVQSIVSRDRIDKFDQKRFKLILVDEAHHIVASSYMQVLKHFQLVREPEIDFFSEHRDANAELPTPILNKSQAALVGVSATFSRFDGLRLSDAIDRIVYHKDYIDMIGEKWLSDVIFTTVQSKADLSKVKMAGGGDFQIAGLSKAVNTPVTNEISVQAWKSKAGDRKSTLIFCVDLAHVSDLTAAFRRHGVEAKFVTGDTPKRVRQDRLNAFRNGDFPVLLNCGVFTEGTDIPNIDCVLLARPTRSRNLLVQMIGRGMRLHPEKVNCHIIDMVASLEAGIVTTPTLFGLDPAALVQEANVDDMKSQQEREELEAAREEHAESRTGVSLSQDKQVARSITFTDYDSVYDLIDDTSSERHIRSISQFAWVMVRQNRYVLSNRNGDYITIEASSTSEGYTVIFTGKLPPKAPTEGTSKSKSPYMRPREIATASTLSDAVHAADTFASEHFVMQFVHAGQAWRGVPATEGQLMFLSKLRPQTEQLNKDMITKGKATDMISKIKFGARGWYSNLEAAKKRAGRVSEKQKQLSELRNREKVKVGALRST